MLLHNFFIIYNLLFVYIISELLSYIIFRIIYLALYNFSYTKKKDILVFQENLELWMSLRSHGPAVMKIVFQAINPSMIYGERNGSSRTFLIDRCFIRKKKKGRKQ